MADFDTVNRHGSVPIWQRSGIEVVESIRNGTLTVAAVTEAHLARIAERDAGIRAWIWHDPFLVRKQVNAVEGLGQALPLIGVPIGIKDVIDTSNMPTSYGSPIYRNHRPVRDAEVIIRLLNAGAIIMGKTVTTEFAYLSPGATVNPLHPSHTPGGSSSGSAAAVADGMVPVALATQTGGSTIRPAAYCGILGFKPSYSAISMKGIRPLARSMDTVGLHARFLDDLGLIYSVLAARIPTAVDLHSSRKLRIAYFPGPDADRADSDAQTFLQRARRALVGAGHSVGPIGLPKALFAELAGTSRTIMAYEAAGTLKTEFESERSLLSAAVTELISRGLGIAVSEYQRALMRAAQSRAAFTKGMRKFDCLLTFSTPSEAPLSTAGTGDSVFNRIWTMIGVPCLTIPFGKGSKAGLPMGIQLVGRPGRDFRLLTMAKQIEPLLRSSEEGEDGTFGLPRHCEPVPLRHKSRGH